MVAVPMRLKYSFKSESLTSRTDARPADSPEALIFTDALELTKEEVIASANATLDSETRSPRHPSARISFFRVRFS
jgi:hypothetical protein